MGAQSLCSAPSGGDALIEQMIKSFQNELKTRLLSIVSIPFDVFLAIATFFLPF
jgi:hypothetical protein